MNTFAARGCDVDFAFLQIERDALIRYDSNDDGQLDLLLTDKGTDGSVEVRRAVTSLVTRSGLAAYPCGVLELRDRGS
jgi:hypothetical protein